MLDTPLATTLLILMEVAGPIVLLAAIIYGTVSWRRRSREAKRKSEEAARRLLATRDPSH